MIKKCVFLLVFGSLLIGVMGTTNQALAGSSSKIWCHRQPPTDDNVCLLHIKGWIRDHLFEPSPTGFGKNRKKHPGRHLATSHRVRTTDANSIQIGSDTNRLETNQQDLLRSAQNI